MRKKITAVLTALVMLTGCTANASVSSENASSSSGFSSENASSASDFSSENASSSSGFSSEVSAEGSSYSETQSVTRENDNVNNLDSDEMKVHFIDVGQGDSIFIELPNTKTMLIDAAEKEYADRITNYIYSCGYNTLDYVVATHPHSDHIGGMADVIGAFNVENVILSPATHTTKSYTNMLKAIDDSGAKVKIGVAGTEIFSDGDLSAVVIAPVTEDYSDLNNSSVMVMLTYGSRKFLFTGDAENSEENTITADIKCDVLKVGHHGSSTSTSRAFLTAASPEYAVISCGMGNSYGHPHIETLDRLKGAGVKIYRTDLQGDIIMTCDGEKITVNAEPSAAGGASSGESKSETTKATTTTKVTTTTVTEKPAEENPVSYSYVLNTNTMKIHRAGCSSVSRMSEENKGYTNDYDGAIAQGYVPCKICSP